MDRPEKKMYPMSFYQTNILGILSIVPQPYECGLNSNNWKHKLEEIYYSLGFQIKSNIGSDNDAAHKLNSRFAAVCYQLGRIYHSQGSKQYLKCAESMFVMVKDVLNGRESETDNVLNVINSLNMLSLIKITRDENYEVAMRYLLMAGHVYRKYCESKCAAAGPPTPIGVLLDFVVIPPLKVEKPLICARLYTLFYLIEVYKKRKMINDILVSVHTALELQVDNSYFLQSPLDWAMTCAQLAAFFSEKNAHQQARNHLVAASIFMEKIIPEEYSNLYNSLEFKEYSADISYFWSRYGLDLLQKSKVKFETKTIFSPPPDFITDLLFKNFDILNEERVTIKYVTSFKDASLLANSILMWIDQTKQYYTFEKKYTDYVNMCLDKSRTYTLLSHYQDDPDEVGRLLKRGIVDLELIGHKMNGKSIELCRSIWYELGTIYCNLTDIKYERYVVVEKDTSERITEKINWYSDSSVNYFKNFVESFYINEKLPERLPEQYIKPVLLAYMQMAKCHKKTTIDEKNDELEIMLQCQEYYLAIQDYCKTDPRPDYLIPDELAYCNKMLLLTQSKQKNPGRTKHTWASKIYNFIFKNKK